MQINGEQGTVLRALRECVRVPEASHSIQSLKEAVEVRQTAGFRLEDGRPLYFLGTRSDPGLGGTAGFTVDADGASEQPSDEELVALRHSSFFVLLSRPARLREVAQVLQCLGRDDAGNFVFRLIGEPSREYGIGI